MNTTHRLFGATAAVIAMTLALTGCGGQTQQSSAQADPNAIITVNGSEPLNPLTPQYSTESGGSKVANLLFSGLVAYDKNGKLVNEVAKSIKPDSDSKVWNITLNDGWTFTNGEQVTADSFINAWNYAAKLSNGMQAASYFSNIEGYSDETDSDLTGLKKTGDLTFTVTLKQPESDFRSRLGYIAFAPIPQVAYKDMKAFGENPIGNGPYKLAKNGWSHDKQISLVRNDDYQGVRKARNGGVNFVLYTDLPAAYADVQADNLDVLDTVPDSASRTYAKDFPDRNVNQPAAIFQAISIPFYVNHWSGKEGQLRRKAISYAIDRKAITEKIFAGTRSPATDFSSPAVPGHSDSLDGADVLTYNPKKAKKLWAEADAISDYGSDTFTIAYNSDGGHKQWVDAVCNYVKNTLGIKAEGAPYPTFSASLEDRLNKKLTGATRAAWQADWPSLFNFLNENYHTGASSSLEGYSNDEVDRLLDEGAADPDEEASTNDLQQAEEILLKDLPSVPLWNQNAVGVWSQKVSDVTFGWDSVPLYYNIQKS